MFKKFKLQKQVTVVLSVCTIIGITAFLFVPRMSKEAGTRWKGVESFDYSKLTVLHKAEEEDFKILMLSDVQLTEPWKGTKQVRYVMDTLIKRHSPNLLIFAGDNVGGVFSHFQIRTFTKFVDSYGILWTTTFGNHDRDKHSDVDYQLKIMQKSENFIYTADPTNVKGRSNFVIPIENSEEKLIYNLFMIDSHGGNFKCVHEDGTSHAGYDFIDETQLSWFEDNVAELDKIAEKKDGEHVPSMVFSHFPIQEFAKGYSEAVGEVEPSGIKISLVEGKRREGEGHSCIDKGLFETYKRNNVTHVFAGHEHTNDYSLMYDGMRLTYGVKTGDHSTYDPHINGGTLITIGRDNSVSVTQEYVPIK